MSSYKYESFIKAGNIETVNKEAQDELYVNGETISSQVEGYKQLTVTGRHLYPLDIMTVDNRYRSGAKVIGKRYKPREIKVKYRLHSNSSEELRNKTDKIMGILVGDGSNVIKFKDDMDYYYKDVILTGTDEVEESTNNINEATFVLTAYDPYRYSEEVIKSEVVNTRQEYVTAESIEIEFKNTVTRPTIVLRSDSKGYLTKFRLNGTVNAGTKVKINQTKEGIVYTEGASIELGTLNNELTLYQNTTGYVEENPNSASITFIWRDKKI